MKKNVRKKILSLIVCAALVFAMAVPAFAENEIAPYTTPNMATTFENGGLLLATASGSAGAQVSMNAAGSLGDGDHYWWYLRQDQRGYWRLYSGLSPIIGNGLVLDRHINGSTAILWQDYTDIQTLRDSVVDLMTVSAGTQRIKLSMSTTSNQWLNVTSNLAYWTTSGAAFHVST